MQNIERRKRQISAKHWKGEKASGQEKEAKEKAYQLGRDRNQRSDRLNRRSDADRYRKTSELS